MVNRKVLKSVILGAVCIGVPIAVIAGNVGMSKINPYYRFYRNPVSGDENGYHSAYLSAQYLGAKVIIAPGFTHKSPIESLFSNNKKGAKDLGFILLDEAIEYRDADANFAPDQGSDNKPILSSAIKNTASVTFRSDLGSIQAGVAIGQFLNDYVHTFGPDLTFGMYGGLPFGTVTSFMGGVQKGLEWFNQNVVGKTNETTQEAYKAITIIEPQSINELEKNFAGGFGPSDGMSVTNAYLQEPDLDMFMPVAGPQIWTAQKRIIELNKKTLLVGVDSPAELDALNQPLPFKGKDKNGQPIEIGNGKFVQFSSEKNLAKVTNNILTIINNGNVIPEELKTDSNYTDFYDPATGRGGLGTISIGNAANGSVGVSESGKPFLEAAIKASTKTDPSLDAKYSEADNMKYTYKSEEKSYANDLKKEFKDVLKEGTYSNPSNEPAENFAPFNLKGFIRSGYQPDDNLIKIVLSEPTSVLFDGSFSESAYKGMVEFYRKNKIFIPVRKAGK